MTRIEENLQKRELMAEQLKTSGAKDETQFFCGVLGLLTDISVSLAVIADRLSEKENK